MYSNRHLLSPKEENFLIGFDFKIFIFRDIKEGGEHQLSSDEEKSHKLESPHPSSKDFLFFGIPTVADKNESKDISPVRGKRARGGSFDFTK
jgi:hypothetical protein